jgi:hypothetical protein
MKDSIRSTHDSFKKVRALKGLKLNRATIEISRIFNLCVSLSIVGRKNISPYCCHLPERFMLQDKIPF